MAIASYREAIRLKPDYAEAHNNLGTALRDKGQLDDAIASHSQAIRLKPDYAEAYGDLGTALARSEDRFDEAIPPTTALLAQSRSCRWRIATLEMRSRSKGQARPGNRLIPPRYRARPDSAEASQPISASRLRDKGRLDEAIAAYNQCRCSSKPDLAGPITILETH